MRATKSRRSRRRGKISRGTGIGETDVALGMTGCEDDKLGADLTGAVAAQLPATGDLDGAAAAGALNHQRPRARPLAVDPLVVDDAAVAVGVDDARDHRRAIAAHGLGYRARVDAGDLQRLVVPHPEIGPHARHDGGGDQAAEDAAPPPAARPAPRRLGPGGRRGAASPGRRRYSRGRYLGG